MERTAFHKWLERESNGDLDRCADLLKLTLSQNSAFGRAAEGVWDLLEQAQPEGGVYSDQTFKRAASLALAKESPRGSATKEET